MTAAIEFRNVKKIYRRKELFSGLDLSIPSGTFAIVFGAPGSGKSVVLRLLTGLEKVNGGDIFLRGENAGSLSAGERNIGYIPQSFALYPHYKVFDNIAYPLTLAHTPKAEIEKVVGEVAEMLRITKLLTKTPNQLSGGEKQRVAIARGIAKRTNIYVFDDPLTGLDFKLREQLFDDLKNMQEELKATFLYTTSDALEALMLAKHISVLDRGRCVETGDLITVYSDPQQAASMDLLGFPRSTMLPGEILKQGGKDVCQTKLFSFPVQLNQAPSGPVVVGLRPQDVLLESSGGAGIVTAQARILLKEDLGGELVVHLSVKDNPLLAVVRHDDVTALGDDTIQIGFKPSSALVFDTQTGNRIGQGVN